MNTEKKVPVVLWNNKLLPVCITGCRGGGIYLSILIIEEGRYMSQYTDHIGGEVHISVY